MNKNDIISLLESQKNERGIENWNKLYPNNHLKSFGIGLTQLRKIAKNIGRSHELAAKLWDSNYYDIKVLSLLIDDPKKITPEQAELQVEQLDGGYLAHVFSSCDATLAKTTFTKEIADKWMVSDDPIRRRCGYGLLYELSKSKKKDAPDTPYFLSKIQQIERDFEQQDIAVRMAMAAALMGMGLRTLELNKVALKLAQKIGPIDFDERGKCDPYDVSKHLTSAYAKKKFGLE